MGLQDQELKRELRVLRVLFSTREYFAFTALLAGVLPGFVFQYTRAVVRIYAGSRSIKHLLIWDRRGNKTGAWGAACSFPRALNPSW